MTHRSLDADEQASRDRPVVTVCGLGPGAEDLITAQTASALEQSEALFLRTGRHPTAHLAKGAVTFDDVYDRAESFDQVYSIIADQVVSAARERGSATYCVPGSPLVLERSVRYLQAREDINLRLLPAISFLDEVWARLQVDPVDDGVRLIDGHRFAAEAAGERGPVLVAHIHAQWVLSEIKLTLAEGESLGDDQPVVVLQRLGTPEERIYEVAWSELDRAVDADHLTSLYLPRFEAPVAGALAASVELMRRLRNECPWDRAQDHASLRSFLIEEAYEVLDALDRIVELRDDVGPGPGDGSAAGSTPDVVHVDTETLDAYADLESELGDLLFQILFHARLAAEAGQFDIGDVARTLIDKMVGRHPHVFGDRSPTLFTRPDPSAEFGQPDEHRWDQLKAEQVNRHSVLDGIPRSMPSLARSAKVLKRMANSYGPPENGRWLRSILSADPTPDDIGSLLVAVVELARRQQVDPEFALRENMDGLERAFRGFETGETVPAPGTWVVG